MKIYMAGLMTGRPIREVAEYYRDMSNILRDMGYDPLHPMTAKGYLAEEIGEHGVIKSNGYATPLATDSAIIKRDAWMVAQSDVFWGNLYGAEQVSIGVMQEMGMAYALGKYIVITMEKGNPHEHSFVLAGAGVRFYTEDETVNYLHKLIRGEL